MGLDLPTYEAPQKELQHREAMRRKEEGEGCCEAAVRQFKSARPDHTSSARSTLRIDMDLTCRPTKQPKGVAASRGDAQKEDCEGLRSSRSAVQICPSRPYFQSL